MTISTHLDIAGTALIRLLAKRDDVSPSKFVRRALDTHVLLNNDCRRLQQRIHSTCADAEKAYFADQIGRATLKAYEDILDARYLQDDGYPDPDPQANAKLDTEEAIEAAATRICSR